VPRPRFVVSPGVFMLRPVRGPSAPPQGVRFLLLLISWISIAGGLLAASSASAASSELLAAGTPQAASDSAASAQVRPPRPAAARSASGTHAFAMPKPPAYRLHLHGGLFEPPEVNATSPTLGMRFGRRLGAHLQGGLLVGWTFERKNLEQPVNGLPGLQPHLILARADGHLLPAMMFLQVNFTEKRFLVPYAGIAAGYEWFILRVTDYRTGEIASAKYGNWAWENWG